jgi:hypothetical protein
MGTSGSRPESVLLPVFVQLVSSQKLGKGIKANGTYPIVIDHGRLDFKKYIKIYYNTSTISMKVLYTVFFCTEKNNKKIRS